MRAFRMRFCEHDAPSRQEPLMPEDLIKPPAMTRILLSLGALQGAACVALSAALAHGPLAATGPMAQPALTLLMWHVPALLVIGLLARPRASRWLITAGVLMQGGLMLFSWNLLARALLDFQALRSLVPVGGMALIAGWLVLAVAVNRTAGSSPGAG
jgi:uncharacterized membrane protein YgdD (TMEM256/DUF423 family)